MRISQQPSIGVRVQDSNQGVARPSSMRRWRTQAHEKDVMRMSVFGAVGIGIAFGIEIAIAGYFDVDADLNPDTDSDAGVSRSQLYFRNRNHCDGSGGRIEPAGSKAYA